MSTINPRRHRCTFIRSIWMRVGHVLSMLVPLAASIALVTPVYLCVVGVLDSFSFDAVSAQSAIMMCIGIWIFTVSLVTYLIRPFLAPAFGCRFRSPLFRHATVAESMGTMFMRMRITILVFVVCQILSAMFGFLMLGSNTSRWGVSNVWNPLLLGSVFFLFLGCFVTMLGNRVFLNTRGRKLKSWLHACWRGVAHEASSRIGTINFAPFSIPAVQVDDSRWRTVRSD